MDGGDEPEGYMDILDLKMQVPPEATPSNVQEAEALQEMNEVRQLEHNRRFQAAVLRTMDSQLDKMEHQLLEQEGELISSERAREDMGLAFMTVKSELTKLRHSADKQGQQCRDAVNARKVLQGERDRLLDDNKVLTEQNALLNRQTEQFRQQAARAHNERHQIKQVNKVFTTDMAVYRQLNENLTKEVESLGQKENKDTLLVQKTHKLLESKQQELHETKQELEAQENETKKAQAALERTAHELSMMQQHNAVLTSHWEHAKKAMSQRDETQHKLNNKRVDAENDLKLMQSMERTLLLQNDDLHQEVTKLKASTLKHKTDMAEFLSEYARMQELSASLGKQLQGQSAKVEELTSENSKKTVALEHLRTQVSTQHNKEMVFNEERKRLKLEMMRDVRAEQIAAREVLHQVGKREEKMETEAKSTEHRLISLENERQAEKYKSIELEREVRALNAENKTLSEEMKALIDKHNDAQSNIHTLEDDVERLTYRTNKAEAKAEELHAQLIGETETMQTEITTEIRDLEAKLQEKKQEYDAINAAFVKTQTHVVAAQRTLDGVNNETDKLKSRLAVNEQVNSQLTRKTKTLNSTLLEREREVSLVQLDLSKSHQIITNLKTENKALQSKLEDTTFLVKAKVAEHKAALATMHSRLYNTQNDKSDTTSLLKSLTTQNHVGERKYEKIQFQYANMVKENELLAKSLFALKKQLKDKQKAGLEADKQYHEWAGQFEAIFAREVKTRSTKIRKLRDQARSSTALPDLLREHDNLRTKGGQVPHIARRAAVKATNWSQNNHTTKTSYVGPQTARNSRAGSKRTNASRTEHLFRRKNANTKQREAKFVETLVHELRKELNRVSTIAAERLNEVVSLKEQVKGFSLEQHEVEEVFSRYQHDVGQATRAKQQLQQELLVMNNKYLRSSSLAASLEQQLIDAISAKAELRGRLKDSRNSTNGHDGGGDVSSEEDEGYHGIDFGFKPDIQPSAKLFQAMENAQIDTEYTTNLTGHTRRVQKQQQPHRNFRDTSGLNAEAVANLLADVSVSDVMKGHHAPHPPTTPKPRPSY